MKRFNGIIFTGISVLMTISVYAGSADYRIERPDSVSYSTTNSQPLISNTQSLIPNVRPLNPSAQPLIPNSQSSGPDALTPDALISGTLPLTPNAQLLFPDTQSLTSNLQISTSNPIFEDILYDEGVIKNFTPGDSVQYYIDKAHAVMEKIRETQNYITNLNEASGFDLPVGIGRLINGLNYDIGIEAIRLKPTHAEIDVFMEFEIPQNGKRMTFMARGIKFTKAGGIIGDARLELIGDVAINFNGDKSQLVLKGGNRSTSADAVGTYVRMDCDGFREMSLDAEVRFSRDLLVPEDANGNTLAGNVAAPFQAVLSNWNDLIVQLSLPGFQVKGLNGFGFQVKQAMFDFSDLRNAPGVVFPQDYPAESDQSLANLWRGFYARELTVRLPSHFKNKQAAKTTLSATDLIIDHQGVSGVFAGKNLIPLNNGDMNGWAFSVDSLAVSLIANHVQSAGFKGQIVVPVSDGQSPFNYTASLGENDQYLFTVAPTKDMQFKLWQTSKVEIYKASRLEVSLKEGKFLPKAVLHGSMNISARLSEKGQGINLADIKFENLEIQSVKPYIKTGAFSFGSEAAQQKMAGFPISIKNIAVKQISDQEMGLQFSLLLNLTNEKSGAFAADAGFTLVGRLGSEEGMQKWKFKEVEVQSIKVDIDGGAFKFNGDLVFYRNDIIYGDGFNGIVNAEFIPKIKVRAGAIFGNLNGMRYWYADAMATFKPGILMFPGVAFYGFGGGAYHHMKMATAGTGSALGKTASGVVYVPDQNTGLGIKAILNIGASPSEQSFNGDVTFEVAFFNGGGIRTISMTGNAYIATPRLDGQMEKLTSSVNKMASSFDALEAKLNAKTNGVASLVADQESMIKSIHGDIGKAAGSRGAISAHAFIQYDFENKELHGNFNVKINLAGGLMQGNGDAVLHFAPQEWYVYAGTPDHRMNVSMGIGPIRANTRSYFMVGSKIPASPPPPDEVSKILQGASLDYMKDLNTIASGGGFAFGSAFDINTGDLTFLMFYAQFHAGTGFDIMLKNYGDTYCAGNNERIGINGWYANGQAYGFFEGNIGIKVKVFGKRKSVEILNIGAAAILQVQLPNPIWMKGTVGGYFNVLGGLVKGDCRFEITLGEKCTTIKKESSLLDNIKVIAEVTPAQGEKNVSVFNMPQTVFNLPVEKVFELADDDGSKHSFRIKLDYFQVTSNGQFIPGMLKWNDAHDVVAFNSYEILPPQKEIKAKVHLAFQELRYGYWTPALDNGNPLTEEAEVTFVTGTAPDYIPLSNVEYSYPIINQCNFYKNESTEGYIKLRIGQAYLFSPGAEWRQIGRFTSANGSKTEFGFSYDRQMVRFTIPSANLTNNMVYALELVNVPNAITKKAVDVNVKESTALVATTSPSVNLEIKKRDAEGTIEELQEKSIYTSYFRSSSFNTFVNKLDNLPKYVGKWYVDYNMVEIRFWYEGIEYFDKFETGSFNGLPGLITTEAVLDNTVWYTNSVKPLVYADYPIANALTITHRTPETLGVPPVKAVYFYKQSDNELKNPYSLNFGNDREIAFVYNLPLVIAKDFQNLRTRAAELALSTSSSRVNYLLTTPFPVVSNGTYQVKVRYSLPGLNKVTSEKIVDLNYVR